MQHERRYDYQMDTLFPDIDADVLVLHECTKGYMQKVYQNQYLTETYQISNFKGKGLDSIILSKFKFTELCQKSRRVYALFDFKGVNFIIVAAHLVSNEKNIHLRRDEIRRISETIADLPKSVKSEELKLQVEDAIEHQNVMLIGDLNLHLPCENNSLEEFGWNDVWLDFHSHLDGFTWNASINTVNYSLLLKL